MNAFLFLIVLYLSCIPVIASRINGTEDFITPDETGDFVKHDAADVAAVLRRLCANPQHIKTMGENARRRVEENYTWDRIAQMTEEAYQAYLTSSN